MKNHLSKQLIGALVEILIEVQQFIITNWSVWKKTAIFFHKTRILKEVEEGSVSNIPSQVREK